MKINRKSVFSVLFALCFYGLLAFFIWVGLEDSQRARDQTKSTYRIGADEWPVEIGQDGKPYAVIRTRNGRQYLPLSK